MTPDPLGLRRSTVELWLPPCEAVWHKGQLEPGLMNLNDARGLSRWRRGPAHAFWKNRTREVIRRDAGYRPMDRAWVTIRIWWPSWRMRRDASNYMPTGKAILDGLVAWDDSEAPEAVDMAGFLPDDNDRHVIGPLLLRGHDAGLASNLCRVQVLIRELDADEGRWWPATEGTNP